MSNSIPNLFGFDSKKDSKRILSMGAKRFKWTQEKRHICPLCEKPIKDFFDAEFDHKIAHSKGGKTNLKNIIVVHKLCNRLKSNKSFSEIKKIMGTHIPKKRETKKVVKKKRASGLLDALGSI